MTVRTGDVRPGLERWARERFGAPAVIAGLTPMPGNSGDSFGFDVVVPQHGPVASLVIRLAPPGVRRRGNTDVLRQVPLLHALEASSVPIAPLVWWTDDGSWFGTDAIVQRRLDARPLHMTDARLSLEVPDGDTGPYLRHAVRTLARIHAVDWRRLLGDWERPRSADEEVRFWAGVLRTSDEPAWVAAGEGLGEALRAAAPVELATGLFHGDYQTNNVLFRGDGPDVVAVVDWEIAGIGPQLVDLGWIAMMSDPSCWDGPQRAVLRVVAAPEELRRWYEEATQRTVVAFDWHRAFACYRFGAIAAFNVRLHRTGRRVDATYERIASSVPVLFERGRQLVAA